jgi:2-C-methyl-D-erythritol 2,4-cyclodiphosphate synthase
MRIGMGYDVHKLVGGRNLILGGVNIPHHNGLLGHSDADVLLHAIMDSLLGALALGDIGYHFPDTDNKYKNISSLTLLNKVSNLIREKGYDIENIDSTIIAQKPKLLPYIKDMRINISNTLKIDIDKISVKATTEEGLGFTGTEQGIAAQSICLLTKQP